MPGDTSTNIDTPAISNSVSTLPPEVVQGRKRLLGIVLIIIGLVWLMNSMLPIAFDSFFGEQRSASFDQRYTTQHVILDSTNARVTLRRSDDTQLRVRFEQDGREQGAVQAVQEGTILRISHQPAPCFFCDDDVMYELDVPDNIQVDVRSITGDIEAHELVGTLSLASQSGNIDIFSLTGKLSANSSSGNIHIKDASLEDTSLETTSGEIDFSGSTGQLLARTVSGNIQLHNDSASPFSVSTASGDIDLKGQPAVASDVTSISGDIDIKLSPESSVSLDLSTVSGELKSTLELSELSQTDQSLRGKMGTGEIPLIVHTTSGDVHVGLR